MMGRNFSLRRTLTELGLMALVTVAVFMAESMLDRDSLRLALRFLVVLTAVAPTLFWLYYSRSQWRERSIGRALMASQVTTSVVLWWTALAMLTPRFEGKLTGWLVVFSLAFYSYWRLFIALRRDQMRATRAAHGGLRHVDRRTPAPR